MPQFSPDQVTFNDLPGYGMFDVGHAREHSQFFTILAQQTPAIVIPDYPLLSLLTAGVARADVLRSHLDSHRLLRQATGITGIDLSQVDLDKEQDFYDWLGYHSQEHAQIRQVLGVS